MPPQRIRTQTPSETSPSARAPRVCAPYLPSVLGNGLYADPRSIVLTAINLSMVLTFASVLVRGRTAAAR